MLLDANYLRFETQHKLNQSLLDALLNASLTLIHVSLSFGFKTIGRSKLTIGIIYECKLHSEQYSQFSSSIAQLKSETIQDDHRHYIRIQIAFRTRFPIQLIDSIAKKRNNPKRGSSFL